MTRKLLQATTLLHLIFGVTLYCNLHLNVSAWWAAVGAVTSTAALAVLAIGRIRAAMHDAPRRWLRVHAIELPYFVHWCACVAMALPATILLLVAAGCALSSGAAAPWIRAAGYSYAAGLVLATWGVYGRRRWFVVRERELGFANLPLAFDGYRIAHLSDLHIGALTPASWAAAWARAALAARPDLIVVTGDLVTNGVHFHAAIAEALASLRAPDGVLITFGNHDYFGEGEPLLSLLQADGHNVLRNEGVRLRRGSDSMYIAGCDDTYTARAEVTRTLRGRNPGEFTVLLAHDPDLWYAARGAEVALTLSGHTHGGQVAWPFLGRHLSLSHLAHAFHVGLYLHAECILYVHPGLGTTGPPIRIGTTPTVAIHRLRRLPSP